MEKLVGNRKTELLPFYVGTALPLGLHNTASLCVIVIGWSDLEAKSATLQLENQNREHLYKTLLFIIVFIC